MGLKTVIQGAVGTAFTVINDLATSTVVFRHYDFSEADTTDFDATTGGAKSVSTSYTDTTIAEYLLADYSEQEIANGIAGPKDKKLIFPQSELSITPSTIDEVLIDSVLHVIADDKTKTGRPIKADPAAATWTIRIREA